MKNRIVKQVLMICMVSALSVSMPITSFAADSKKEASEKNENDDITMIRNYLLILVIVHIQRMLQMLSLQLIWKIIILIFLQLLLTT